jgi:hypothetical protein
VATLELEKMKLQIQGNSKGHHHTKSSSKQNDLSSIRQPHHSYAEEVEIMEENVHNSARSSHNMVLARTKDESNMSNYSDELGDLDERSKEASFVDYREYSDDDDEDDDGDLQGHKTYESHSKKSSLDHTDSYSPLREVSLEDADRQSYDPKRYHTQAHAQSLGTTTDIPKTAAAAAAAPAENHHWSRQSHLDSSDRHDDKFADTNGSQFSVASKKNDLEKTTTLNSRTSPNGNKDRKVEIRSDGVKITRYSNGTVKYLFPDGTSEVKFVNGDIKTQNPGDSTLVYFYAQAKTTHTTYADGTEVYSFPTGQVNINPFS